MRESVSQEKKRTKNGNSYAAAADSLSRKAPIPDFYVKYTLDFF